MKHDFPNTRGFTLIELLISLLIMTMVIIGVLSLFDSSNHLAKVQIQRVDLQQSVRIAQREIARAVRLAGRGGLPISASSSKLPDAGWSLSVTPNVAPDTRIGIGGASAPLVVEGTDILTLRGVINTPVYVVDYLDANTFSLNTDAETGTIKIKRHIAGDVLPQDLTPLRSMIRAGRPEALLLVSAFDDQLFAVVEFDDSTADPGTSPEEITLRFKFDNGTHTDAYRKLSGDGETPGVFPSELLERTRIGTLGILEEYRFYLRATEVQKLSRARTYPNTDVAYANSANNLKIDIADHIIDFQIAYAFAVGGDSVIDETADGALDDWFGNASSDPDEAAWAIEMAGSSSNLRFLRFSLVAKTAEGDRKHQARKLVRVEDRIYKANDPLNNPLDPSQSFRFPRLLVKSTVEIRNL